MDNAKSSVQLMMLQMVATNVCVCFPSGLRGWESIILSTVRKTMDLMQSRSPQANFLVRFRYLSSPKGNTVATSDSSVFPLSYLYFEYSHNTV